jgi:hypothetical protein
LALSVLLSLVCCLLPLALLSGLSQALLLLLLCRPGRCCCLQIWEGLAVALAGSQAVQAASWFDFLLLDRSKDRFLSV